MHHQHLYRMKIAFLGLGIMGSRMAANCLKAGHPLTVWNRDAAKSTALVEAGAQQASTPAEIVHGAEVVITMLATPAAVEAVAFGENGFAAQLRPHQIWMDCSTVDPAFAKTLGQRAQSLNFRFLEAPVAGTKGPAEAGELLFLAGGSSDDVASVQTLLDVMGKKTLHLGAVGQGAAMKILINGLLAQSMLAFAESVHLGRALGLAKATVFDVLLATPVTAPFLSAIRGKTEGDDHSVNFPLKHMRKDLHLAASAAYRVDVAMPSLNATKEVYASAVASGLGDLDFSAVFRHIAPQ